MKKRKHLGGLTNTVTAQHSPTVGKTLLKMKKLNGSLLTVTKKVSTNGLATKTGKRMNGMKKKHLGGLKNTVTPQHSQKTGKTLLKRKNPNGCLTTVTMKVSTNGLTLTTKKIGKKKTIGKSIQKRKTGRI